jgi:hypothetical protein
MTVHQGTLLTKATGSRDETLEPETPRRRSGRVQGQVWRELTLDLVEERGHGTR